MDTNPNLYLFPQLACAVGALLHASFASNSKTFAQPARKVEA